MISDNYPCTELVHAAAKGGFVDMQVDAGVGVQEGRYAEVTEVADLDIACTRGVIYTTGLCSLAYLVCDVLQRIGPIRH